MPISIELLLSIGLTLSMGLMIGIERSYRAKVEGRPKGAGIRTFPLVCLAGFLLVHFFGDELFVFGTMIILFTFSFLSITLLRSSRDDLGMTTSTTLLVIFLAGMFVGVGNPLGAVFVSVVTLSLTASKDILHRFAGLLSQKELESAVRFLAVVLIVLPITYTLGPVHPLVGPDRVFDPTQAVLMVIFVSSISFVSFLVIKLLGTGKGMEISAFIGGLVSSAAATASMSEKCKNNSKLMKISTVSILLSHSSMLVKDYVIILTVAGLLLALDLTIPVGILLTLTVFFSWYIARSGSEGFEDVDLDLENPFALKPALKFGLLFTVIWASTYILKTYLGGVGVYIVSIGGLISTTSVSASIASMYATGEIGTVTSLSTILLAFGLSSFSKIFIARSYFKDLAKSVAWPMIITGLVSFIIVLFIN